MFFFFSHKPEDICYNRNEVQIMENRLNTGSQIELEIKKLGINGEGIGYYQKRPFLLILPYQANYLMWKSQRI